MWIARGDRHSVRGVCDGALTKIYNEASGRSKEQRQIRESCKKVLDQLRQQQAESKQRMSTPLSMETSNAVLEPLRLACLSELPKLMEPALNCLHKLVAHAYLQGESTSSGRLNDDTIVANVMTTVAKCGEHSSPQVQLAVLQALLTATTAEHFVAHGDALMQAVRTAFNIAIGSEVLNTKRTAQGALLQMLNTTLKRVTLFPLSRGKSMLGSQASASDAGTPTSRIPPPHTFAPSNLATAGERQPSTGAAAAEATGEATAEAAREASREASGSGVVTANGNAGHGHHVGAAEQEQGPQTPQQSRESGDPPAFSQPPRQSTDLATLDEANGAADGDDIGGSVAAEEAEMLSTGNRTAQLASLAEQADIKGLEKALDAMEAERVTHSHVAAQMRRSSSGMSQKDVRRVLMRDRRALAWRSLLLPEKDVLTVFSAVCKMAARDTGLGAVEQYMHQGKLLALDLLYRVLSDPHHSWSHARPQFCEQLCQALCGAMLRNAVSVYDEAHRASVRLLACVLEQPSLRSSLKAEMGAFVPLLLLRPLEQERPDSVHLLISLQVLQALCKQPQLMVDLFVNYDCDLQAANLFERVVRGLSRVITSAPNPNAASGAASGSTAGAAGAVLPSALKPRDSAILALLGLLESLEEWAAPLQEQSAESADGEDGFEVEEPTPRASYDGSILSEDGARELAKFASQKEHKRAVEASIELFNRNPIKGISLLLKSGALEAKPAAIARFIKDQGSALDPSAVGEYLGHHDDLPVAVMHAYIDIERFPDLTLDAALRMLLKGFRLPGEAQKIDRIMEKFAERYCRDNPDAFATADAAYLLAFALIMLNTDAHNPMAEKKLSKEDFVNMCQTQVEGTSDFQSILPREELEAMYVRIIEHEIVLPAPAGGTGSAGHRGGSAIQGMRLAAAVGLTQLLLPFRAGEKWDKQHGVGVERAELVARTRDAVARGLQAGHLWHVATHAQHARPMLQVAGVPILKALKAGFEGAADSVSTLPLLDGFCTGIRLAGLLGLDAVGEAMVGGLTDAAALHGPSVHSNSNTVPQPSSVSDAKRVAALERLVELANGPSASFLGSGWVRILRTLSALEALVEEARGKQGKQKKHHPLGWATPNPSTPDSAAGSGAVSQLPPILVKPTFSPNPHGSVFGGSSPATGGNANTAAASSSSSNPIGRFFTRLGLGGAEQSDKDGAASTQDGQAASGTAAIKPKGPDAALVIWAEGPGADAIQKVYARSGELNGDAVVVFVRALCAVSQEELSPADHEERPRAHSLSRLIDCGYNNLGRIRLIWRRLWAALSAHLVSASCHPDPAIARLAVDHMRALVSKLLARAELSNFTHQDEALRPFVAVLRHCDSVGVRERCVQCIALALTAHPRGLGSGWRAALQALAVAASDSASQVVDAALDALQPVVEALWRGSGSGHDHFSDTVSAIAAAVRNPVSAPLSVSAVHILQSAARRLAETPSEVWLAEQASGELKRQMSLGGTVDPSLLAQSEHPWGRVLGEMALAGRHDPRTEVADQAASMLLETTQRHAGTWDAASWEAAHSYGFAYLLELPFPEGTPPDPSGVPRVMGWSLEGQARVQRHAASLVPQLSELLLQHHKLAHPAVLQKVLGIIVRYTLQADTGIAGAGVTLLHSTITQQAPVLEAAGWSAALKALSMAASSDALTLTAMGGQFSRPPLAPSKQSPLREAAVEASSQPSASSQPDGSELRSTPSQVALAPAPGVAVETSPAAVIRGRCRAVLMVQRACSVLHRDCEAHMPASTQLLLLAVLQDTVQRAMTFNRSPERRISAASILTIRDSTTRPSSNQLGNAAVRLTGGQGQKQGLPVSLALGRGGDLAAVRPALLRQEAEGGKLLTTALLRCSDKGSEVASEAQSRLLSLGRKLLTAAADDAWQHHVRGPEGAAAAAPEGSSWEEAIRAPLIVAMLQAYSTLAQATMQKELHSIFPHLARLICCGQPTTRQLSEVGTQLFTVLEHRRIFQGRAAL
ncbi:hypothetical protein WJX73_004027 [Symbiochloris irregularis]|uniref:SEC7 domain-containing protein n=1 Tax=Symbiochloris irregularis TaxID=706552 RepID=A0AAW1NNF4_9CHLO